MKYLVSLNTKKPPANIGNKALNLYRLQQKKFKIPKTYICTWDAYQDYQHLGESVLKSLNLELGQVIEIDKSYAVRSSANIEDSNISSFAGQFTSLLNVSGVDQVCHAVQSVWEAAQSEAVQIYLERSNHLTNSLLMAVIIQEMVTPVFSGVSFSRNPITGVDETIVEAVRGDGSQLVQSGITPLRWVSRWGTILEQPDNDQLPPGIIERIVQDTNRIAKLFRRDIDLEWVYDGDELYWVQLRDITALMDGQIYSNRIAREMLPGAIKPLVWSVSVPVPTRQWARILNELVGETHIEPERLVKAFHYHAYFNMGQFGKVFASLGMPRDSLERMMGMLPPGVSRPRFMPGFSFFLRAPRLTRFVFDKFRFGGRAEREYPLLQQEIHAFATTLKLHNHPWELLKRVNQITEVLNKISYNVIITILLMQIYNALLRKFLKSRGVDFSQFNLTDDWDQLQAYNPNHYLADLHERLQTLDPKIKHQLSQGNLHILQQEGESLSDFRQQFDLFLERFGHMSDSTVNFTSVPWRETPDLIMRLILDFAPPETTDEHKINLQDLKSRGLGHIYLHFVYRRARQFRLLREMYSSLYTYTLMVLRDHFHMLGSKLVEEGLLSVWEDIFFLYLEEIIEWVRGVQDGKSFASLVSERKDAIELSRQALLPEVIYGDAIPPLIPKEADRLEGIPTSGGYYAGPARIVHGLSDFQKVEPGDVLVIPYSDVSWTPLFARAGAVIAESGGILSHSSIIAREYNIPAVVSVKGCMNIPEGALVDVDGYKGLVYLKNPGEITGSDYKGVARVGSSGE